MRERESQKSQEKGVVICERSPKLRTAKYPLIWREQGGMQFYWNARSQTELYLKENEK